MFFLTNGSILENGVNEHNKENCDHEEPLLEDAADSHHNASRKRNFEAQAGEQHNQLRQYELEKEETQGECHQHRDGADNGLPKHVFSRSALSRLAVRFQKPLRSLRLCGESFFSSH